MSKIELRAATIEDSEILLLWANKADSLKWKQNTHDIISSVEHNHWLKATLLDKETALWIIMAAEKPVGQVRLEKKKGAVHTDIYLTQDKRGKGHASTALTVAMENYCNIFGPQQFQAVIHKENTESQVLFSRQCFKAVNNGNSEWLHFIRTIE